MSWRSYDGSLSLTAHEIRLFPGTSTWSTRLSSLGNRHGMVYVCTFSLPSLDYCEAQLGHRPHDILLLCHAKFIKKAKHLQERFADIEIRVHPAVHAKLLCIAPDTVFVSSANFGDSGGEEATISVRSQDAIAFYERRFTELWAEAVSPFRGKAGVADLKRRERAIETFAFRKYGARALELHDFPTLATEFDSWLAWHAENPWLAKD
jgi:hypothetical protein